MGTARGPIGVVGVRPEGDIDPPRQQVLTALVDQAAVAVERVRLANDAARSAAHSETQKLRTALLNSLSHDLRTPLAGIRGAAGTLRESWEALSAETRTDLLGSIEEDTARMTRFLANIMEMTRLESGEIVPRIVPVALTDVLEAAIARVPGLGQAGQHLLSNLPDDLPRVAADPALLEQVVVNILDNAMKYAPAGGFVRVSATPYVDQVLLSVADEGVGIAPEDLPHVFDSFYRAKRGDRVAPGTGLGLAIAHGLMEAMGGSIEAISPRPDAPAEGAPGTVIQLRLPLAP